MGEWQPIETAPKDGTWVLLCGGKTDEDDYMNTGVNTSRPVTAFFERGMYAGDGGWLFCFWDGGWRRGYDDATHWMPLPPTPSEKP